jgi:hypothetical protein
MVLRVTRGPEHRHARAHEVELAEALHELPPRCGEPTAARAGGFRGPSRKACSSFRGGVFPQSSAPRSAGRATSSVEVTSSARRRACTRTSARPRSPRT